MNDWLDDCLLWRGRALTGLFSHWCAEWDDLPIDETCPEWPCCAVAYRTLPRKLKKWAINGFAPRRTERLIKRFHRICELTMPKVYRLDGQP